MRHQLRSGNEGKGEFLIRINGQLIKGLAMLVMLALSSCTQQNDKVGILLGRLAQSNDETERAEIVGTDLWDESDPRIEKAYVQRLSRGRTAEDLGVAWYLAKRGNRDAVRILNDNYYQYPVSSWGWSYAVDAFARQKYEPAIPNLIWSLRSASLNLGGAAYTALRVYYPDAPGDLPSPEAAYQYFKKRFAADQGPLGKGQFALEHVACCVGDANDLPPPMSCGKWVVQAVRPRQGVVQLVIGDANSPGRPVAKGSRRIAGSFERSVGYFWIPFADGPRLAINDYAGSNVAFALLYDPQTGKTVDLGERVWKERGEGWIEKLDHIYSATVACSPDGRKLIVHMWGHESSVKSPSDLDHFLIVDPRTGAILSFIMDPDLIGSKWWQ